MPNSSEGNSAENQQDIQSSLNPLLNTESWFCLSVKQTQDSGETGYTTLWNYINPATFNQSETSSDRLAETIVNFIKDGTQANLTAATQETTTEILKGVSTLFDGLENWLDETFPDDDTDASESILETVIDFFEEDNWSYVQIE